MLSAERTVLITGAAGAIGTAAVRRFLDRNSVVLGLDRREVPDHGVRFRGLVCDLNDHASVIRSVNEGLEGLPPLAHYVGVAGGALPGEPDSRDIISGIDLDLFASSLAANLTTQVAALQAALPGLKALGGEDRSVTFTSSFNALSAQGMPGYSAAKAGLVGLMYACVRPLGAAGIRVNVVAPGTVRTPRTELLWASVPDHFERLASATALGRLAEPDDVAAAFVSLALDLAHVTGHVLVVDGGQMAMHG